MTFVNGANDNQDKKVLWKEMCSYSTCSTNPWIIEGDFNSLLKLDERIGEDPVTVGEIKDFMEWVDQCCLQEIRYKGPHFTWSKALLG